MMERLWWSLIDAPWREYPAAVVALFGFLLVVRGLWVGVDERRGLLRQGRDAYAWIRCFQYAVGGLNVVFLAVAWVWQLPWLAILAIAFVGEEMLETSRILTAMNNNPRRNSARVTRVRTSVEDRSTA